MTSDSMETLNTAAKVGVAISGLIYHGEGNLEAGLNVDVQSIQDISVTFLLEFGFG